MHLEPSYFQPSMLSISRFFQLALLCSVLLGCKSTDQTQYADLSLPGGQPAQPVDSTAPTVAADAGTAKIVIKGTRAGASQQDIAVALMAATRKLGPNKPSTDINAEMRMANQTADAILAGDKVVLEGASRQTADLIAQDLRTAGLLVTISR